MSATAYPLTWPTGFPRAKTRDKGQFKATLNGALTNVQDSLRRFSTDSGKKLESLVISSNVTLGAQRPEDPGVAVWFVWDGMGVCVPVDRYLTVEANLQAIHHIIEARRTELRHGTLALVRATFAGFLALPSPGNAGGLDPYQVIKASRDATQEQLKNAYRRALSTAHPDKGGSADKFHQVSEAGRLLGLV